MKIIAETTLTILFLGCAAGIAGQTISGAEEELNFGYSKNPPAKSSKKPSVRGERVVLTESTLIDKSGSDTEATTEKNPALEIPVKYESVASKTRKIAKEQSLLDVKPTEIYKVGIGDVLFISLQESKSSYFTVLSDGSIDYPLAGGLVAVSGLTVGQIEELLREKIQLFENPEVVVTVKEHASHAIDVGGLVAKAGRQYLQREAMPLYVIRARSMPESGVTTVIIKRSGSEDIVIKAEAPGFDDTLIYPGDIIEFTSSEKIGAENGFIYIGGEVNDAGRFAFFEGLSLMQAIMTAGGVSDKKFKKAVITRKDAEGFLKARNFKLNDIRKGKSIDPKLKPGDMVEVIR